MKLFTQLLDALRSRLGVAQSHGSVPLLPISISSERTPEVVAPLKTSTLEVRKPLSQDEFTMMRSLLKFGSLFEGDNPSWRTNGRGSWDRCQSWSKAVDICEDLIRLNLVEYKPAHCCADHAKTHRVFSLTPRGRSFIEQANTPNHTSQIGRC